MFQQAGYRIKVLNTINFSKSMKYNPFVYIHSEKDVLKLVRRKFDLYVPQRRPTQDDRQDHRSHAGYGRGYVDAGPADPFQAETYDGF